MDTSCCTDTQWKGLWDPFVRLCYQLGMLLGKDEFEQEAGYQLCKHRLSQRLYTGWGVTWGGGFSVDATGVLTVQPLFALDELGRELWLKNACTIDLLGWMNDNQVAAGATIYLSVAYRTCCVAPVPAMAAPCDDAASATMASRVLESAECRLSTDAPTAPIGLRNPALVAAHFAELVADIQNDADRPLLLGTITNVVKGSSGVTASLAPAAAPRVPVAGVGADFTVLHTAFTTTGTPTLDVTFSAPPLVAPLGAFFVEQLQASGTSWTSTALVKDAASGGGVTLDGRKAHVTLTTTPVMGSIVRVFVSGTGPAAVLGPTALTGVKWAALDGGRDHTTFIKTA